MEFDFRLGKQRFVMHAVGAGVVDAGDIRASEDPDDTWIGFNGREIDAGDLGMRAIGKAQRAMQQPGRFGNIINIIGGSGDVLMCGIMA